MPQGARICRKDGRNAKLTPGNAANATTGKLQNNAATATNYNHARNNAQPRTNKFGRTPGAATSSNRRKGHRCAKHRCTGLFPVTPRRDWMLCLRSFAILFCGENVHSQSPCPSPHRAPCGECRPHNSGRASGVGLRCGRLHRAVHCMALTGSGGPHRGSNTTRVGVQLMLTCECGRRAHRISVCGDLDSASASCTSLPLAAATAHWPRFNRPKYGCCRQTMEQEQGLCSQPTILSVISKSMEGEEIDRLMATGMLT